MDSYCRRLQFCFGSTDNIIQLICRNRAGTERFLLSVDSVFPIVGHHSPLLLLGPAATDRGRMRRDPFKNAWTQADSVLKLLGRNQRESLSYPLRCTYSRTIPNCTGGGTPPS